MCLTGKQLIGADVVFAGDKTFQAGNPETGELLKPFFYEGTPQDVDRALVLAERDFDACREIEAKSRANFLETIALELLALEKELVERATQETGLPQERLSGELGRTVHQLRLFAQRVKEGSFLDARIDRAIPDRTPLPKPDIRQMQIALGPVAVFGASNFPLAFSVVGGDTASALAAGCTVVVKGHPAHPGTSELAGQALRKAVTACSFPEGTFSLIQGSGTEVGAALVQHPLVKAVAFTGSLAGGRALFDLASSRPEPIAVYAEMGSVNPVFLLPQALRKRCYPLAEAFVGSMTAGVGQFCTSPGLVFAIKGPQLEIFVAKAGELLSQKPPGVMLHEGIKKNFQQGIERSLSIKGVDRVLGESSLGAGCSVAPVLLQADAGTFFKHPVVGDEVFGPSAVIVACDSRAEMVAAAQCLQGQLTATVHGEGLELNAYADLFQVLERKAGRVLVGGFPTGVEVCDSMNHGGPYPATTDSRSTSVGTAAIKRFLRPVCYQNFPQEMLPGPLKNKNEHNLWRLIDGRLTQEDVSS